MQTYQVLDVLEDRSRSNDIMLKFRQQWKRGGGDANNGGK